MPAVAAYTQNCCVHDKEGPESPVQRETPYPKGHLDVLAAPYFHVLVIAANLVEIIFQDGEEATSKRGRPAQRCRLKTASSEKKQNKKKQACEFDVLQAGVT